MTPVSLRDRLSPTGKEKLWCKVCLHPHLEQGGTHLVEKNGADCFFFFSLSYRRELTIPSLTPLNCILKNWDRFDLQGLKKTHLVFLCDTAWPWYPLEDDEWWPVEGSLKFNTVLQLDLFCKKQGKWVEVVYVLPFFSLQNMPDVCPKSVDLGVKPSGPAPPSPPTLAPYPGLQAEVQTALVSVETQTEAQTALASVETQTEIQTASVSVGTQIET